MPDPEPAELRVEVVVAEVDRSTNGASTLSRSPRYTGYVVTDGHVGVHHLEERERVVEVGRRRQLEVVEALAERAFVVGQHVARR